MSENKNCSTPPKTPIDDIDKFNAETERIKAKAESQKVKLERKKLRNNLIIGTIFVSIIPAISAYMSWKINESIQRDRNTSTERLEDGKNKASLKKTSMVIIHEFAKISTGLTPPQKIEIMEIYSELMLHEPTKESFLRYAKIYALQYSKKVAEKVESTRMEVKNLKKNNKLNSSKNAILKAQFEKTIQELRAVQSRIERVEEQRQQLEQERLKQEKLRVDEAKKVAQKKGIDTPEIPQTRSIKTQEFITFTKLKCIDTQEPFGDEILMRTESGRTLWGPISCRRGQTKILPSSNRLSLNETTIKFLEYDIYSDVLKRKNVESMKNKSSWEIKDTSSGGRDYHYKVYYKIIKELVEE